MNSRTYKYDRTILGDDGTRKAVGRSSTAILEKRTTENLQEIPKSHPQHVDNSKVELHTHVRGRVELV
jgi:hypothetical protein